LGRLEIDHNVQTTIVQRHNEHNIFDRNKKYKLNEGLYGKKGKMGEDMHTNLVSTKTWNSNNIINTLLELAMKPTGGFNQKTNPH
jgi:hypothetical protein